MYLKSGEAYTDNKDVVIVNSAGVATAVGVGSTNVWGYFDGFPKRYFIVVEK